MSEETSPVPFKKILNPEEFGDGDIIRAIRGTITALYKVRSGEGRQGHFEYQDGRIKDEAGTEMTVTFASCTQPESAKGKKVTISSVKTENFGKQGVKLEIETFKKGGEDVTQKKLRITKAANIVYEGGAPRTGESSQAQTTNRTNMQLHPKEALKDMLDMHSTIASLVSERYPESQESKASFIATIFIEAARQGLIPDFANRYGKKVIPAAPKDPSKWSSCVVPKGSNEGKTLADIPDEDLLKLYSYLVDSDSKTDFAKCVYQAAMDRDILPKNEPETAGEPVDDNDLDDIPF
jgi:hypothetical protein